MLEQPEQVCTSLGITPVGSERFGEGKLNTRIVGSVDERRAKIHERLGGVAGLQLPLAAFKPLLGESFELSVIGTSHKSREKEKSDNEDPGKSKNCFPGEVSLNDSTTAIRASV
jgi:hypothetical protein